ncbi:hypothetical protein V492_00715 [Pseudogymnoascus sp. VKM F-4246]|nr:hypothetical protein V492_00715 [Pseudogymnoascus sp. VKM F-4246]KFY34327.1 hypothetical protein V494_06865 [Pseudogymnoascus sp. VKM F-4513 (FW-928)]
MSPMDIPETGGGRRQRPKRTYKDAAFAGQASWISSNVNLVNTIIGAGTLAMPLAMAHMGILLGTIVIIWSAMTASFGLYLQSRCARYLDRGQASFFALSQMTYPSAAVIFDGAIAIKCFGVGVSYLIIIGDLMPGVVKGFNPSAGNVPFLVDRHFWITVFMLVVIPLSFLRRLDSLKYTSVVALISIGYLVILVVYHFAKGDTMADRGPIRVVQWESAISALSSLPVIVFAYTCHQNMFAIVNEIKDNSPRTIKSVIGASIGSACSTYIVVAITGYLSFGSSVAGNIVGMYAPNVASTIAKAAIVVLVIFSFPLQVHPCRASVVAVLKWRPARWTKSRDTNVSPSRAAPLLPSAAGHSGKPEVIGDVKFAAITTVIVVLSYIVAMSVSSLDTVLAYVGATGSTSISFILPGIFYYKISSPDSIHHQRLAKDDEDSASATHGLFEEGSAARKVSNKEAIIRYLALGLVIYGFVVMATCLTTNTYFLVSH